MKAGPCLLSMFPARSTTSAALIGFLLTGSRAAAQEQTLPKTSEAPAAEKASDRADEFLDWARQRLAEYQFTVGDGSRPLEFREEPILRWTIPDDGEAYGGVFLWTEAGRPVVIGSFLRWYSPFTHSSLEFHSLTEKPVAAEVNGKVVWRVEEPGLRWASLTDAAVPATSPTARLVQLRSLARGFSGEETSREGDERTLRLLEQPLFRSEAIGPQGDLALFAFSRGTDPEILLLLEAQPDGGWRWAAARLNSIDLRLVRKGTRVWEAPQLSWLETSETTHPYCYTRFGPIVRR